MSAGRFFTRKAATPGHWAGVSVLSPERIETLANDPDRGTHPALVSAEYATDGVADDSRGPVHEMSLERRPARIAVLVAHGMGQQLPFETLDNVAEAICTEYVKASHMAKPDVNVRFVAFGEDWTPRAELNIGAGPTSGPRARDIHIYEAYWAPFTEGEVGISDVFTFILGAARRGLTYGRAGFGRYLFGEYRQCALSREGLFFLGVAFVVILLAAFFSVAFWVAALTHVLALLHMREWRADTLTNAWRVALIPMGVLLMTLFGAAGGSLLRTSASSLGAVLAPARRRAALAAGLALLAAAIGIAWSEYMLRDATTYWLFGNAYVTTGAFVLLGAAAIALNRAREAIVQYLGDVAIYVSSFTVNRFWKIRSEIQDTGRTLARNVYGAHDGTSLLYDHVIVVGHSLGSVVAYDMLNDSIQRDLLLQASAGASLGVVARTPLFLTFGSPLDKIAFFFRTQADALVTREALATATQPLIRDYQWRPANWINIWSPFDWISGALDYYDRLDPSRVEPKAVINRVDPDAPILITGAHPHYWTRAAFTGTLYDAITNV
jgi:hypothetical protein